MWRRGEGLSNAHGGQVVVDGLSGRRRSNNGINSNGLVDRQDNGVRAAGADKCAAVSRLNARNTRCIHDNGARRKGVNGLRDQIASMDGTGSYCQADKGARGRVNEIGCQCDNVGSIRQTETGDVRLASSELLAEICCVWNGGDLASGGEHAADAVGRCGAGRCDGGCIGVTV